MSSIILRDSKGRIQKAEGTYLVDAYPKIYSQLVNPDPTLRVWDKRSVAWKCTVCSSVWNARPERRWKLDKHCPMCFPRVIGNEPNAVETAIHDALTPHGTTALHLRVPIRWRTRKNIEVDVLFNDNHIIEFDSRMWHKKNVERDLDKTQTILEAGWSLLRIRETYLPHLEIEHPNLIQVTADWSDKPSDWEFLVPLLRNQIHEANHAPQE